MLELVIAKFCAMFSSCCGSVKVIICQKCPLMSSDLSASQHKSRFFWLATWVVTQADDWTRRKWLLTFFGPEITSYQRKSNVNGGFHENWLFRKLGMEINRSSICCEKCLQCLYTACYNKYLLQVTAPVHCQNKTNSNSFLRAILSQQRRHF